jgi:membrane-associated phospholipid phosphatase
LTEYRVRNFTLITEPNPNVCSTYDLTARIGGYALLLDPSISKLSVSNTFIPLSSIEKYKNEERFGMPSGHAQSIFFSIVYLYNLKHSIPLLFSNLFIASLTLYQRWKYRRHTVEQLATGSAIGGLFAWAVYSLEKYINK